MSLIPIKPEIKGRHSSVHFELDERIFRGRGLLRAGAGITISWDGKQYVITSTAKNSGGSGGFDWMYPDHKELDPTLSYSKGKFAAISPGNPLVTTGMLDLVSGSLEKSPAGIWLCVQNVPAQVVNPPSLPAGTYFNMPQGALPGATGTPTGTPLKGDYDGDLVYWVWFAPYPACF